MLSTSSTTVFACYDKACAPPPTGKGGSLKGAGSAPRTASAKKIGLSRPPTGSQYAIQKQESYDAMEEAILMDNLGGDVATKIAANERVAGHLSDDSGFRSWLNSARTSAMSEELRYGLEPIVVGSSRTFSVDQREQIMNELLDIAREHVQNRDLSASRLEDVEWAIKLVEETNSSLNPKFAMLDKLERLFEVSSLHDVARAVAIVTGDGKDVYETAAAMVTRMTIDSWAAAADNDVQQTAAALEHDTMDALKSYESYKGYTMSARVFMDDVELAQAYVRAEYAATQEWLKEMGIQKVVVYRGMNLPPDTYGDSSQSDNIPVNVQMNPLSSWAWASEDALPFTEGDDVGVLFKAVVPASMIQSLPQTGRGCLDEKEVILIGAGGEALVSVSDGGPTFFTHSTAVFACLSKACAPPPVGRGGSIPSAAPPSRWRQGVSMSGSFRYRPQKSEVRKLHRSGTADNLTLDRPFRDEADQIRLDVVGKRVNDPQFMDKWRSRDQRLGEEIARTLSGDEAGVKVFKQLAKLRLPSEYELEQYLSGDERAYALSDTNFAQRAVDNIAVMMYDANDAAPNREAFYKALGSLRRAGERTGMPPTLLQVVKAAIKAAPVLEDGEKSWEFRSPENLMASLITGHAVGWWQQGVYHPQNIFYHQIAAEVHGVPDMQYEPEVMATVRPPDGPVLTNVIRMVTDLEYRRTQRILSEGSAPSGLVSRISKGGTVTLYRGVRGNFDESVQAGSRIKVSSNPLSSWTTDVQTAKDFSGSDEQGGAPGSNTNGVVLAMEVPVELIQSISTDGRGAMSEFEVILVSPAGEALVLDRTDGTVPMPSIPAVTASATVFACLSKACAPPPTGKGGSLPRAHGSAVTMDEVRASAKGGNPIFDKIVFNEADEFRLKGNPSGDAVEIDVAGKMLANRRIMDHLVEDEGFKKWQERTGMDDEGAALIVKMVIDQWASDASPSSAFSLCQHRAAANVHDVLYIEARRAASSAQVERADDIYAESGDLFEAIVRAEYKATQEWFAQHGIKEVVLHRGMALDHDFKTGDVVSAQMYPLSSWSESWSEGKFFSDTYSDRTRKSIVLSSRVPVEMIQSIPLTGRGCLLEFEFVLIGKPMEALVSFDGSDA